MRFVIFISTLVLLQACSNKSANLSSYKITGNSTWFAVLDLGEAKLPFKLNIATDDKNTISAIKIKNGQETIDIKEFSQTNDSLKFKLPFFDNEFIGIYTTKEINGYWFNYAKSKDYKLPLRATKMNPYNNVNKPTFNVSGKWQATFSKETDDPYPAIAELTQNGNKLNGTFLTETGDYRFLSGYVDGNELVLSAFDGAHAFLFKAIYKNERLSGTFYSGKHWKEPWEAIKNEEAILRDAETLTYLKEGYEGVEFAFPNAKGDTVSLQDEHYKNKVVIVQVLGSWCPNCMDESRLYASMYNQYKDKGLEIIGLAFERPDEPEKVAAILNRYKNQMGINYEILWAGKASKKEAAEKLPMLNHVMSFPTSIFLDKNGIVKKIHTGFSGPATSTYKSYEAGLHSFLNSLLSE